MMASDNTWQKTNSPNVTAVLALAALAVLVVWHLIAADLGEVIYASPASELESFIFNKGVLSILLIGVLIITRTAPTIGLARIGPSWTILLGIPLILLCLAIAFSPGSPNYLPLSEMAGWLLVAMLVAFSEEVVFRGYIQTYLQQRGIWFAAILSSAAFGSVHLLGLLSDIPSDIILAQCAFAFSVGLIFTSIRLAANGLWLPIGLHFVFDGVAFLAHGGAKSALQDSPDATERIVIAALVLGVCGLISLIIAVRYVNSKSWPPLDYAL